MQFVDWVAGSVEKISSRW